MRSRSHNSGFFTTVTTEGGLFPSPFLQSLVAGDTSIEGLTPESYHLDPNEKLNEVISRTWNGVLSSWKNFQSKIETIPDSETGTTETRERWLQPLFRELGYGRLLTTKPFDIDGKRYEISHLWQKTPIHLISYKAQLHQRSERIAGATRSIPHSMVQEFLNRSGEHTWAFLSNGLRLRILRDNVSLSRQAYIEFDLEAMMNGEVYADFVLLWLLCHESRVEGERPELCWLERWTQSARKQGTRVLEDLRKGVKDAIEELGSGFLIYQSNATLKEKLKSGSLTPQDYYRQLLRIVYRLLFLFVTEEREVLLIPNATEKAKSAYQKYYSTKRLRILASKLTGTKHGDLWFGLQFVFEKLGAKGCTELALPALGSFLWSTSSSEDINDCGISNRNLLEAIRKLSFTVEENILQMVDYKNLGMKELGSVYESLLELHPRLNNDSGTFSLEISAGNERKTSGSYYTDDSLVECLLDSALNPVLEEACKKSNPEEAVLNLKVCDPASGSGHFLIAAAHRMAKKLAALRTGEDEPAPEAFRTALRDVIGHCIYGVDINPMAVELCKFTLWLEAIEPGKPLSFLDHHIQCGNSLLGTTPALLKNGVPDEAFTPIEGDEKSICQEYKKINKKEREKRQMNLFNYTEEPWEQLGNVTAHLMSLIAIPDDTLEGVQKKEQQYAELVHSSGYEYTRLLADTWCASFVWKKNKEFSYPITEEVFRKIEKNPFDVPVWMKHEILRLANQYQFFHWHLEFPDVFHVSEKAKEGINLQTGWVGGFDVMLGNPPWERIKLQEKEWFAERSPDISNARNASERKKMIDALKKSDPVLFKSFIEGRRQAEGESIAVRETGRYPLCGRGDVNTYAVFAELFCSLVSPLGRGGIIVPSGIATDDTTKFFFQNLMDTKTLISLYDFENSKGLFPGVHRSYKFCLLTHSGIDSFRKEGTQFVFFAQSVENLLEEKRRFNLTAEDIAHLNPNTKTCPIFRSKHDAVVNKKIYLSTEIFGNDKIGSWKPHYMRLVDLGDFADDIRFPWDEREGNWNIPLYESKMMFQYDHRFASFNQNDKLACKNGNAVEVSISAKADPFFLIEPRYYVRNELMLELFAKYSEHKNQWLLVWRDITNASNERTSVVTVIPHVAASRSCPSLGFNYPEQAYLLLGNLNSYVFDYLSRQKAGGVHLNFTLLTQIPVIIAHQYTDKQKEEILCCVLELVYTAWDLKPFAKDCGYEGPPFKWDEDRRFILRCELDATYFHLYSIERDDVKYIMETFPIVKRKDEKQYGEYRTKRVILEIYDEMAEAMRTGVPYKTRLNPPPADASVAHKNRE